jgi:glycosyltransferase involved in cell wall biosynthesis
MKNFMPIYLLKAIKYLKSIVFTVTNDLTYDRRMHRICNSLAAAGYEVLLIGRKKTDSKTISENSFNQKRLGCIFQKGILFYAEYNLKLFFALLQIKADCFCAIDLDTILPVLFASSLKNKKRVYDAHELFTEQKEIITRPFIHSIWSGIAKFSIPKFKNGYTVNDFIKNYLQQQYKVNYAIVRNLPLPCKLTSNNKREKIILYQGAVNEGRCFETLIPAMQFVEAKLIICGEGNFFDQTKQLIKTCNVEDKIELKGWVTPDDLVNITAKATIGLTLFEATGLNQYQSLANRFFDYIIAAKPQVCVNFPQYKKINEAFNIAYLITDSSINTIANALNELLTNDELYNTLQTNCIKAREELNWLTEEPKLLAFWKNIFI